jgi:hypothetical protein
MWVNDGHASPPEDDLSVALAKGEAAMPTSTRLWPTLDQVLRRQEFMDRMMRTSGVDVLAAVRVDGGLAFFEARAKCRFCLHEGTCRGWLESADGLQMPPDFCPNARFFRACRCEGN